MRAYGREKGREKAKLCEKTRGNLPRLKKESAREKKREKEEEFEREANPN